MSPRRPNPCRNCPVHTSICAIICSEFKKWRAEREVELARIADIKHIDSRLVEQVLDGKARANKRRRNKR